MQYHRYREIWILDLVKFQNEKPAIAQFKILNLRALYCKYATLGIWAEYITNSTLAVTMHKDGDDFAPIWEITDDGQVVKQLTMTP